MKLKGLGLLGLLLSGIDAQASGFALSEQNASGLGNAFAGQVAAAEDASTVYFNPAGMTLLDGRQISVSADYIAPSAQFSGTGTPALSSSMGGDAGKPATVPAFFYTMGLRPGLKFGLGVSVPFGLETEYDMLWAGETQAVKSRLQTVNVNPSVAWQVNDRLSLGLGLDSQKIEAELTTYSPLLPGVVTMAGDDTGMGWDAGALYQIDPETRIGLSYRSKIDYHLAGTMTSTSVVPVTADITTPDSASLGVFRRLGPKWDVLAEVTWTGWSVFQELRVNNATTGAAVQQVAENWRDTLRYSLGFNYHRSDRLTWRFGMCYDETPVPDAQHRTPRIPDQNRTMLAVGAQYKLSKQTTLDAGYAHLFLKDAPIQHTEGSVTLNGNYSISVDIVGLQMSYRF